MSFRQAVNTFTLKLCIVKMPIIEVMLTRCYTSGAQRHMLCT